jgi:sulfate adenylyltransferase subunit 1
MVLPSGFLSTIKGIYLAEREMPEAFAPMSVTVTLEDEIDLGRGGMIVRANNYPKSTQDHDLMVCWFDHQPGLTVGKKLLVRHTSNEVKCVIKKILYKMDINSLHRNQHDLDIRMNDIARIIIRTTQPLFTDPYSRNRITGSLILIDEKSNNTVAAGLVI